jgi:hypothetical protein
MPTRLRKAKPRLTDPASKADRKWLMNAPGCEWFLSNRRIRELWNLHGPSITAEHIRHWPGTRPNYWWRINAVEPHRANESDLQYLVRLNLLTSGERRRLRQELTKL